MDDDGFLVNDDVLVWDICGQYVGGTVTEVVEKTDDVDQDIYMVSVNGKAMEVEGNQLSLQ